jgi:hypothetical protein
MAAPLWQALTAVEVAISVLVLSAMIGQSARCGNSPNGFSLYHQP